MIHIKNFNNFINENLNNDYYKKWVDEILSSWADTFAEIPYNDDEDEQEANAYDEILLLGVKLLNNTATEKDYENILFHLWQYFSQDNNYADVDSWLTDLNIAYNTNGLTINDYNNILNELYHKIGQ
jgi:hypothetical protein